MSSENSKINSEKKFKSAFKTCIISFSICSTKKVSQAITIPTINNKINQYYNFALKNGALGGKLIGAGGGGFLMFYCEDVNFLEKKLKKFNIKKLDFEFSGIGAEIISSNKTQS